MIKRKQNGKLFMLYVTVSFPTGGSGGQSPPPSRLASDGLGFESRSLGTGLRSKERHVITVNY